MTSLPDGDAQRPVRYRIDDEHQVVFTTLAGHVTFADLCAAEDAMLSDPGYRPEMSIYVECADLASIPSELEIRKLALDRLLRGRVMPVGRSAIVATTELGREYAMAWEVFAADDPRDLRTFATRDEACEWLGIPVAAAAADRLPAADDTSPRRAATSG